MGKRATKKITNGNGHEPKSAAINLRVLAAFHLFASKDETRYMLQGVCIELEERHTTYVATDGHRIITRRDELSNDEPSNTLLGVHIIPTPHCALFKPEKDAEGRALLFSNGTRVTIQYGMEEHTFPALEGDYPDWRKSIPKGKPTGVRAQFNLKLLIDLHKLCKLLELGQPIIEHNGNDAPAFIFFNDKRVFGGIMPVKTLDMSDRTAPIWTRRGGPERDQGDIEDLVLLPYDDEEVDPETGEVTKKGPPKQLPPPAETPPDADHPNASN